MPETEAYSIEEELRNWLVALGYDAHTRVPAARPASFLTVERTGGGSENMVDYPSVAIQSWAPTAAEAEATANAVKLSALAGPRPRGVHSMQVDSGPYKFYDEDSMQPRYQIVFNVCCQLVI